MEHMITELALVRMNDLLAEADHDRLVHQASPRRQVRSHHRQHGPAGFIRRALALR